MDELLDHIKQENTLKKLSGDYILYSTASEFWKKEGVESVDQFEHWKAKKLYEKEYRKSGERGFLPHDLDALSTEEIKAEIKKLQEG